MVFALMLGDRKFQESCHLDLEEGNLLRGPHSRNGPIRFTCRTYRWVREDVDGKEKSVKSEIKMANLQVRLIVSKMK